MIPWLSVVLVTSVFHLQALRQRTRNGRNCQYQSNPKFIEIRLQKQTADVKLFMKDFLEYPTTSIQFPSHGRAVAFTYRVTKSKQMDRGPPTATSFSI